jgi:FAD/FMN-containing dehydrogenase/Fe-S oxidoreductase
MTAAVGRPAADRLKSVLADTAPGLVVDASTLAVSQYAFDASNYRVAPTAVAYPRDVVDVIAIARACSVLALPIVSRGAGTSMAGNAIGGGVVLDFSRHLNRVLAIDAGQRTARVESGVVLDALQTAAGKHGLMFGPDPSSHSRATLGGMIGNDACGNHSVAHGRTGDHVRALEVVLADGTHAVVDEAGIRAVDPADTSRVEALATELRRLADANLAALRTELDRIPRQVSGYHLHQLLPERGFNLARSLVGSEGSCAIIVAATVQLVARPAESTLIVLSYESIIDAAADVPRILTYGPSAIEGMDEAIVETMRVRRGAASVADLPEGRAWLYVELDTEHSTDLAAGAGRLAEDLCVNGKARHARVIDRPAERASLWRVREDGAGLAANLVGGERSWPGWEDAAVAPEQLAPYLRDFRALLSEHRYTGVLYGHFGAGCVHVRINFDLGSASGTSAMRTFLLAAADLVVHHGGTLSGEHGDGRARSELLPRMYSKTVLDAFADYKRAWDPAGLLNPGIIVDPDAVDDHLPAASGITLPITAFSFGHDHGDFTQAAGRCVGIGRCLAPTGGVMCPSYRATHEEKDSTRGRARALQDLTAGRGSGDGFSSADVLKTLDLCLSCKACSTDCPTGVDMATYKAEFLHQHYRRRLRPASHYSLGWLPAAIQLTRHFAGPLNAALSRRRIRLLVSSASGITTRRQLPAFASNRRIRSALQQASRPEPTAVLFVDTFTRGFRPELAAAASHVLTDAGIAASPGPELCCGLTWISTGQLGIARRVLARTARRLSQAPFAGKPIIVLEPSCAAALATDLPELVDSDEARSVAARVTTFDAALHTLAAESWTYPQLPEQGLLQTHCHEYAAFPAHRQGDQLRGHGMAGLREAVGCCGLAGNFGFEASHYDTSMAVAELALTPELDRAAPDTVVLADGFSCRTQIEHLRPGRTRPLHLAELLDQILGGRLPTPSAATSPQGDTK